MTPAVEQAFANINPVAPYQVYWDSVTPRDDAERFRRWLFAFCSVHTTWERNVIAYQAIKNFALWQGDERILRSLLYASGAGMYNNRTRYIMAFNEQFWDAPELYRKPEDKGWHAWRDELEDKTLGLGLAKASFAIEMCYPTTTRVVCLDVHMMRLYDKAHLNGKAKPGEYSRMEFDWLERSERMGLSPYIARCAYWDSVQQRPDSRYWSHVFE